MHFLNSALRRRYVSESLPPRLKPRFPSFFAVFMVFHRWGSTTNIGSDKGGKAECSVAPCSATIVQALETKPPRDLMGPTGRSKTPPRRSACYHAGSAAGATREWLQVSLTARSVKPRNAAILPARLIPISTPRMKSLIVIL